MEASPAAASAATSDVAEETLEERTARLDKVSREWQGTAAATPWVEAVGRLVPMEQLGWDPNREMGQSRVLDDMHVARLIQSLRKWPPLEPVRVTVWDNQGDNNMVLLAGQHLSKAISLIAEERRVEGLAVPEWQRVVRADVLKFATPLSVRQLVAGAFQSVHHSLTGVIRVLISMVVDDGKLCFQLHFEM